jgi:hypothetical protein
LLISGHSKAFSNPSADVTALFNVENHSKTCFLSIKTTQKLAFFPLSVLQKLLSMFENLHSTFAQGTAKFDADTLFFQLCHFLGVSQL